MDAVSPAGDGLLFVRGLARTTVDRLCDRHQAAVAIINPGEAYVIGAAAPRSPSLRTGAGRRVPARRARRGQHCLTHQAPCKGLAFVPRSPGRVAAAPPILGTRLLSGIDGAPMLDIQAGLDKLAKQVSHTVQWERPPGRLRRGRRYPLSGTRPRPGAERHGCRRSMR